MQDDEETTTTEEETPVKKPRKKSPAKPKSKPKAKAKKSKTKKRAAANGKANNKEATSGIVAEFGIREQNGERAKVLQALHKPIGRKHTADELAKLTDDKTTTAVAAIIRRLAQKIINHKLRYKVFTDKTEEGRVYALQNK